MSRLRRAVRRLAVVGYRRLGAAGRRAPGHGSAPVAVESGATADRTRPDPSTPPWEPLPPPAAGVLCPVCRWQGTAFDGPAHVELALCPACGSNGRDRFLHWCLRERVDLHPGLRVIECSPRLGRAYREAMATWFFYRTSDYDLRAHAGNIRLDLQDIDLPDDCVDVMLCAHVLEHLRDTDAALAELRRVLAPGGHLLLQVPVLQGRTAPPPRPEFHGDDTPVFWRFGFDLTGRLRRHGFATTLLCTAPFARAVASGTDPWPDWSPEFDLPDLLAGAIGDDLVAVAAAPQAQRLGIEPAYMFLTWDCVA